MIACMETMAIPGTQALWHRSGRGLQPRPVLVIAKLGAKVRVLDLCEGSAHHLIFRDVFPANLTVKGDAR